MAANVIAKTEKVNPGVVKCGNLPVQHPFPKINLLHQLTDLIYITKFITDAYLLKPAPEDLT